MAHCQTIEQADVVVIAPGEAPEKHEGTGWIINVNVGDVASLTMAQLLARTSRLMFKTDDIPGDSVLCRLVDSKGEAACQITRHGETIEGRFSFRTMPGGIWAFPRNST